MKCNFFGGIESESVEAASNNLIALGVNSVYVNLGLAPGPSSHPGCDGKL